MKSSTKVVDKDGEEISADTIQSWKTPAEIRARTLKTDGKTALAINSINTGNYPQEEMAGDARNLSPVPVELRLEQFRERISTATTTWL